MKATMHLHSSKDGNYEHGQELGLTEEQLKNFRYALYEVVFDVEIDDEGHVEILKVNGREVAKHAEEEAD